ncbi:hypothetical protein [Streptomyces parvulus]|uniref:hypothetical protein n=1 Tax=Streptomyces parvulus TaxID=146923 RepID=UPI001E2D0EA7|nr:hypothetical protein [Streptomyces parvulus]
MNSIAGTPDGALAASQPVDTVAVSEPKGAARQGVVIALRSDPQPVTVTGITPGLQISSRGVPVADWLCACGHHERARGKAAVTELQARVRVGACPHTATTEGRDAA